MPPSMDRHTFINGAPRSSHGSKSHQAIDPSTLEPIATIHTSSETDLDDVIQAGVKAFPTWSSTPAIERSRILLKAAAILRSRTHELAVIETRSTGKPYSETSQIDIPTGADVLEYYANLVASGGLNGVCVGIGAWNYPIQIALWKSSPCLAAGNCMVYKPSEFTSLHAEELAKIYKEAGVPDGVFNVVYGGGDVGAYLTKHPDVAKVSFTGQVSTGRKVAGAAAGEMKYVTMELGGKSPVIVLPDADIENAVDGAMMANFFSTGQVCTNGTRVFVPRSIKSQFEKRLVEKMSYIRAGDLYDENTNFGPLVSKPHYEKVVGYIKHGIEVDKAGLLYGGLDTEVLTSRLPEKTRKGLWVRPTVFADCTDSMRIVKEEIFGPVMAILYYDTVEEAVKRANDTPLGLAAGVFGKDINQCHQVISQLEAGITWINTWGESPAEMAVGGWKQSGVGVENGRKGLEAWVRNKSTLVEMGGEVPTVFTKVLPSKL
ncbi:hypothetical protein LTR64_000097 [Lithohypha guttulata]|uniref:uncharacterized protein n=1 Tax=Lithohypha guttulata TaxID=1690604 RepID=UPI002DE069EA|nr:hypothetical protein LTR51_007459 [Lithohypha guttulata]